MLNILSLKSRSRESNFKILKHNGWLFPVRPLFTRPSTVAAFKLPRALLGLWWLRATLCLRGGTLITPELPRALLGLQWLRARRKASLSSSSRLNLMLSSSGHLLVICIRKVLSCWMLDFKSRMCCLILGISCSWCSVSARRLRSSH